MCVVRGCFTGHQFSITIIAIANIDLRLKSELWNKYIDRDDGDFDAHSRPQSDAKSIRPARESHGTHLFVELA